MSVFDDIAQSALTWLASEDTRNWIGTLLTGSSLAVAAGTYALNGKTRREAQPRLVYSHPSKVVLAQPGDEIDVYPAGTVAAAVDSGVKLTQEWNGQHSRIVVALEPVTHALVKVENHSKEVIGPVCVRLTHRDGEWTESPGVVLQAIAPESSAVVSLTGWDSRFANLRPMVASEIIFRDSAGHWWKRKGTEPIRRVRKTPRLTSGLPQTGDVLLSFGTGFDMSRNLTRSERKTFDAVRAEWDAEEMEKSRSDDGVSEDAASQD